MSPYLKRPLFPLKWIYLCLCCFRFRLRKRHAREGTQEWGGRGEKKKESFRLSQRRRKWKSNMLFFERSNGESELNAIYSFRRSNNLFLRSPGLSRTFFGYCVLNENEMRFLVRHFSSCERPWNAKDNKLLQLLIILIIFQRDN